MPFYEYQCGNCGHYLEAMQKITDAPLRKCPDCGRLALKKLLSAPVFRLKGSGWYETDFKSDKETKKNLVEEKKEEPKTEVKSEAKPEAKPEVKPEAKPEAKAEPKAKAKPRTRAKPARKGRR
ncbi:MAG TPA: zinc ribbon domain-containing protein [Steroidobacteraceae bacterium]|nr:zinc ribbon domain-containing protein [Steroidobacteraceae bacterium]